MTKHPYPIDKDLKLLSHFHTPMTRSLFPLMNLVLGIGSHFVISDKQVKISRYSVVTDSGRTVRCMLFSPVSTPKEAPCLVYLHGGGFFLKAAYSHFQTLREYACKTPCKVLFIDYCLVPKHPYPQALHDCLHVYQWLYAHARELDIDTNRIGIGGDSAGGNLSMGLTLMVRDFLQHKSCLQLLIYPVADHRMQTHSMKEYGDTPVWDSHRTKKIWQWYLPNPELQDLSYCSFLKGVSLYNLPPTYIETAEFDCLHDEGVELADKLKQEGNHVTLFNTKGTMHGYDTVRDCPLVEACMNKRIAFMRACFFTGSDGDFK